MAHRPAAAPAARASGMPPSVLALPDDEEGQEPAGDGFVRAVSLQGVPVSPLPSRHSPAQGTVPPGVVAQVTSRQGDWLGVRLPDDTQGWVQSVDDQGVRKVAECDGPATLAQMGPAKPNEEEEDDDEDSPLPPDLEDKDQAAILPGGAPGVRQLQRQLQQQQEQQAAAAVASGSGVDEEMARRIAMTRKFTQLREKLRDGDVGGADEDDEQEQEPPPQPQPQQPAPEPEQPEQEQERPDESVEVGGSDASPEAVIAAVSAGVAAGSRPRAEAHGRRHHARRRRHGPARAADRQANAGERLSRARAGAARLERGGGRAAADLPTGGPRHGLVHWAVCRGCGRIHGRDG